jgi:hypothetical protein
VLFGFNTTLEIVEFYDPVDEDWYPVGAPPIINTDGDPGDKIYVGSVDPDTLYTLQTGDVWIEVP